MEKIMFRFNKTNNTTMKMAILGCIIMVSFLIFSIPVTVNASTLTASCFASPGVVAIGQTVTFVSSGVTGGVAPYSYSWTSACSGTGTNCSTSFSTAGTKTAHLTVSSNDGQSVSAFCPVSVSTPPPPPQLSVSCFASPNPADINENVSFISNTSGAVAPYTYSWSGCSGSAATCSRTFSTSGTKTATVTVHSSDNQTRSATCSVYINPTPPPPPPPQLDVTCEAIPMQVQVGENVTFNSYPTGGTGSYIYSWSGCSGNSQSCSRTYSTAGNKTATLTVFSGSQSRSASCHVMVVEQPTLNVSCYADPQTADINENINFISNVSGGTGSYTYSWSGACYGLSADCNNHFTTQGTKTAHLLVRSGNQSRFVSCYATVNPINTICSTNSQCGTNGFTGGLFCQNNNVYQNYITYTCNNPGTANSYCSNNIEPRLHETCVGNQTCSNGSCINSCTPNYQQRCSGNNLYWYDSCGNQQGLIEYCPNGCANNACIINNNYITVQTNSATNVYNNQATLNGYLYTNNNYSCNTYVWFQWGTSTAYGYETSHQQQNYSGNFSQVINNVSPNNAYHFRAVARDCSGNTVYGQDMTIYNSVNTGYLTVNKTVRNLTNGSGFASSTSANPSNMLMFMITLQATGNQDVQNVFVRDILPANLIYNNQLVVARPYNASNNYSGDFASGINLNTILAGQTVTITYQAQVAPAQNFAYGTTTLNNNVSVTSSNGNSLSSNASVFVTRGYVLGASTISTGLTNNFWVDSFLLPLLITLIGLWMWKAGMFLMIEKWIDGKKKTRRGYKADKEFSARIAEIQKSANR